MGQAVHAVTVTEGPDGLLRIELHAEESEEQILREAHRRAGELEAAIVAEMPDVASVTVSIEPERGRTRVRRAGGAEAEAAVRQARIAAAAAGVVGCHDIAVQRTDDGLCLTMHCVFPAEMSVGRVHSVVAALGDSLRAALPELARVTIHPEPDSN
jgi:divalent metal cation (Fe/Co/Zn/Cd) transporter